MVESRLSLLLIALLSAAVLAQPAAAASAALQPDRLPAAASFAEATRVAAWIQATGDNASLQFMIVDKVNARLFLFDEAGTPRANTPVLLGMARGDDSPPGIGTRKLAAIKPAERITPAGRFVAQAGEDMSGRDIIWIDYGAAIAIHRASDRKPRMGVDSRVARLSSATAGEKRVSLGCVNVSTAFYDLYIQPSFGVSKGIVYILPETRSATVEFGLPPGVTG